LIRTHSAHDTNGMRRCPVMIFGIPKTMFEAALSALRDPGNHRPEGRLGLNAFDDTEQKRRVYRFKTKHLHLFDAPREIHQ
jgi:hypothetical protein